MTNTTQQFARVLGLEDQAAHRARQVTTNLLQEPDLILAMDRRHRRHIVEILPRVSRHTYTLREFARLADHVSNEDLGMRSGYSAVELLRRAVESVAQLRGTLPLLDDPSLEDVIDPYGQDLTTYDKSVRQIVPATSSSALLLRDAVGEFQ